MKRYTSPPPPLQPVEGRGQGGASSGALKKLELHFNYPQKHIENNIFIDPETKKFLQIFCKEFLF
jgi:hypothetical protein